MVEGDVPDDCGLSAQRVLRERVLHLGGADAMARHVEHVVDAAGDPDVAVLVTPSAIAAEVVTLTRRSRSKVSASLRNRGFGT